MPSEEQKTVVDTFAGWIGSINFFLTLLIIPAWKAIDAYFGYRKGKDRDFIISVVKEGMRDEMREIKDDIKELKMAQEEDRKQVQRQYVELIREIKK